MSTVVTDPTVLSVMINAINGTANPPIVTVTNENVLLNFLLDQDSINANYTFADENAICVCQPSGSFVGSWSMSNTVQAALVDLNSVQGTFHYCVRIVPPPPPLSTSNGPRKARLVKFDFDPTIQNDK